MIQIIQWSLALQATLTIGVEWHEFIARLCLFVAAVFAGVGEVVALDCGWHWRFLSGFDFGCRSSKRNTVGISTFFGTAIAAGHVRNVRGCITKKNSNRRGELL